MKGKSKLHWMDRTLRNIIVAMMKRDGRDFTKCELCPATIPAGKYDLHHSKYDGATYYDLRIVCRSCNNRAENKLLA